MTIILVTPLISERLRLPGIIGIIIGGMLIGPHEFGFLEDNDRIQFLSTIGLVYLMSSAGLEVDINQFMKVRARALVFGVITFTFPQMMGMGLGYILGLDWLGVILLGSAFASHTLIAFPILTKLGSQEMKLLPLPPAQLFSPTLAHSLCWQLSLARIKAVCLSGTSRNYLSCLHFSLPPLFSGCRVLENLSFKS